MTTPGLQVCTTNDVKAPIKLLHVWSLQSADVTPRRSSTQPLPVLLKDVGADVKAKPVLPHIDASLHGRDRSSSCSARWVSLRLPQPRSPGHSTRITFPSAPRRLDAVPSSLFFPPDGASPGYSRVSRGPPAASWSLSCCATCLNVSPSSPPGP